MRPALAAALAAWLCAACSSAPKKPAEFDVYLEQFDSVRNEGADIYLRASAIAEAKAGDKAQERREAFEARLQALRIIDRYNKVLVSVARGEDPAHIKSGMKDVGSKLSNYKPSAQNTFAFASAIPYVGVLISGAGYVQEALAKRDFMKAVHAAQKPILAILDILLVDSEPLETLLVEEIRKEQDGPRAAVDSLSGRMYKKLRTLQNTTETGDQLKAFNSLREKAGLGPVPYHVGPKTSEPTGDDLEYLSLLTDQAAFNLEMYKRAGERADAVGSLFKRYRAALTAAKAALAALDQKDDAGKAAATGEFNNQAYGMRQEAVKMREATR